MTSFKFALSFILTVYGHCGQQGQQGHGSHEKMINEVNLIIKSNIGNNSTKVAIGIMVAYPGSTKLKWSAWVPKWI